MVNVSSDSEYVSNRKVAANPTIPIAVDDPRLDAFEEAITKRSVGGPIDYIGADGKSLTSGGTSVYAPTGPANVNTVSSGANYTPPVNGQPSVNVGFGTLTPTSPTSVTADWSGNDLVVNFNWDYSNPLNATVSNFIIEMIVDGVTKRTPLEMFTPNRTQTAQTLTLTEALNIKTFNIFTTAITSIAVLAIDPFYNTSASVAVASVPAYSFTLAKPIITVSAIVSGYSVAYTAPTEASYGAIEIVEYQSSSTSEPTGVTYSRVYLGTITPANIIASNTNARWVKARFISKSGTSFTDFCDAQKVSPTNPVTVDNTPPNEVSSVTGIWSSDDIIVSYTLPVTDPASRVQIQLTAPNTLVGYFYRFPTGTGAQTTTITKKDLFDQFGEHYSSFSGVLKSIDSADNKSSGVSFTVASRPNPLDGITPTFTTVGLSNAYSVNFTLPTGAVRGEVYAKHTAWSGNPTNDEYVVYSGLSPAVITDTDYTTVYIKIRYYDDFGNTSNYSEEGTVVPLDPGLITSFENPISFGVDAVIYAGDTYNSGKRTLFKAGGIFAYDAVNTSPSTQIVSDAAAGSPTFITKQANIGGWTIDSTKIEKIVSGKYTGMESGNTYSFYAGSATSGGDSNAKFLVTPTGEVTAREIYIVGNGGTSDLISAGGLFTVKNNGSLTATSATITGAITASSGSFTGNVSIGASGSLYSGTLSGNNLSGAGFILNTSGLTFSSSGVSGVTTINGTTGLLTTSSANIGGWSVDSSKIYKTSAGGEGNLSFDSVNGYIYVSDDTVPTYTAGINSAKSASSIAFWAGTATKTVLGVKYPDPGLQTVTGIYDNAFVVRMDGTLYATGVEITGTIRATDGYIGTATNGWEIVGSKIQAMGSTPLIEMGTAGQITMENYKIYADVDGFKIFDGTGNILSVNDDVDSSGLNRLYLGQSAATGVTARQVEVSKNAEISGSYGTDPVYPSTTRGTVGTPQDYRSGGLRNMYTITESEFTRVPTAFPDAGNGAVLLVYA